MKRKICVLLLIMVLIVTSFAVSVNADSFNTTLTASKSNVEAGSELTVTVKVSNLDVGDNGINAFSAYLSYDTDMFETLSSSSVDGLGKWTAAYAPGTGKMTLQNSSFVKSDEEILQITLKTKSGLAEGTQGEVKLSNILASNSATEISCQAVSTTITIGQAAAASGNVSNIISNSTNNNTSNGISVITPSNNIVANSTANNTANNVAENVTNNNTSNNVVIGGTTNTVEDNDMPYTGSESGALSRIIIGIVLISLVSYIKIERMKDVK
jgi:hypothetical protein